MHRGVREWLETGREDLELATLAASSGFLPAAAFHAQQAAEKTLKALLLSHHVEARVHSLVELLDMVRSQTRIEPPESVMTSGRKLDPHYIQARYPGPRGPRPASLYDQTIVQELLACAETIFRWVEPLLGS